MHPACHSKEWRWLQRASNLRELHYVAERRRQEQPKPRPQPEPDPEPNEYAAQR